MRGLLVREAGDRHHDVGPLGVAAHQRQREVQRQLATLQLLDAITGQVDRHGGNFFIQFDGRAADEMISLPMFPELTIEQVDHVAASLRRALG